MTPKEKAKELVDKMLNGFQFGIDNYTAKQCELIAVDEIIKINPMYPRQSRPMKRSNGTDMVLTDYPAFLYWHEVRIEIEKL